MGLQRTWLPRARCQDSGSPGPDREREKLYAELFDQMDLNKDGHIDIRELRKGLVGRGLSRASVERVSQPGPCGTGVHSLGPGSDKYPGHNCNSIIS